MERREGEMRVVRGGRGGGGGGGRGISVGRLTGRLKNDMSCDDGSMRHGGETLPMTPGSESRADVEVFERFYTAQSTLRDRSCLEVRHPPAIEVF